MLMPWHKQAIFESKGDKLSWSVECRILVLNVWDPKSPADWMPTHKPTEPSRIKLENFNSIGCPYDERAFNPLDFTAGWLSHIALAIYIIESREYGNIKHLSELKRYLSCGNNSNEGGSNLSKDNMSNTKYTHTAPYTMYRPLVDMVCLRMNESLLYYTVIIR